MSTTLPQATDATFAEQVLASPVPVLVDFTAQWCPSCRLIVPVLEQLGRDEADRMCVVSLDVDTNPLTAWAYNVLSMPTLILFRNGEPVTTVVGARPRAAILCELEPHLDPRP